MLWRILPRGSLSLLILQDPMTHCKGHTGFIPGCTRHRVEKKAPSCQQLFPEPGMFASLGRWRALESMATICQSHCAGAWHQLGLQDPSPSFWQLPGLCDLTAVPSAHRGLMFLCLLGAYPGCLAEGPLSFNTRGPSELYLKFTLLKAIIPLLGQSGGGRNSSSQGASCSSSVYSITLSTEII